MLFNFFAIAIAQWMLCASAATTSLNWHRNSGDLGTTSITVGDTVQWTVTDNDRHTVTSTNGGFSSSGTLMGSGAVYSNTFNSVGSFPYNCDIHNSMKGTISVAAAPTAFPTRNPTRAPTLHPTLAPTAAQGSPSLAPTYSQTPTEAPTPIPTAIPTIAPSRPTSNPTFSPTQERFQYVRLDYPEVVSSGSADPTTWAATIEVRAHRHSNGRVAFNTRAYCYEGRCSYPGPTISLKPGDNFTMTLVNALGPEASHDHVHNSIHSPNTTNVHTHGLHITPDVDNVFLQAKPGESIVYAYQIPTNHAPGLHWYHAHHHGSSALQIMGGLVGALIIEDIPDEISDLPDSLLQADEHVLVMTRMVLAQETAGGVVTQGCGANFACDPISQGPLCTGAEDTSPWNLFREYSYQEFAAEAGSTLPIDEVYHGGWDDRNFVFINGEYRPTIELNTSSPSILRIVHAHGAGPLLLRILNDPLESCSLTILAWDGVYLDERLPVGSDETLNVVAAGRVDVEVLCTSPGLYKVAELLETIMWLRVNDTDSTPRDVVSTADLAGIVRPWYLSDLRDKTVGEIDSNYSVFITQENFNNDICGFWLGVGQDCSNISPYGNAILPNTTDNDNCAFSLFSGSKGSDPASYIAAKKLVTFTGALNEWKLYGLGSAFHPLHVHVNHMQIISSKSSVSDSSELFFRPGQWRDTIPPVADEVTFRFIAADFTGETVTHCHFQRHEDLGMMDTFLVVNKTAYDTFFDTDEARNGRKRDNDDDSKDSKLDSSIVIWIGVGGGIAFIVIGVASYFFFIHNPDSKILPG